MPTSAISLIQASYITAAFSDAAMYPPGSTPGGVVPKGRPGPVPPAQFFFRVGFLLMRQHDQDEILNFVAMSPDYPVDEVSVERVEPADPSIPGLGRIRLVFSTPDGVDREWPRADKGVPDPYLLPKAQITVNVLLEIEKRFGRRAATLEHLLNATQNVPTIVTWCPATEPEPVPAGTAPVPAVSTSACNGQGASVVVVDVGLVTDAAATHPWMHGVTGDPDLESPVGGLIELYGGHGTFIASIIRAMAPQAAVHVARVLANAAAAYETDVVTALLAVLASNPDVISLSAGTHTWMNGGLLSFQAFIDGPLAQHPGTVLVAAAGNDGANWPFAPAEMSPVIGVGALGAPGNKLASFSNWGPWVAVYAPGEDLVHAFGSGTYTYEEPPRRPPNSTANFDHMAEWSGTSFSTPVVAGLIAARKSGSGGTARQAADALLALAQAQPLPGVGPVLYPGQACLHVSRHP